jgi:hypothetical protein
MDFVERPYACPCCCETFTKWSLCFFHARRSVPCREVVGNVLRDLNRFQEQCRCVACSVPKVNGTASSAIGDGNATGSDPEVNGVALSTAGIGTDSSHVDVIGKAATDLTATETRLEDDIAAQVGTFLAACSDVSLIAEYREQHIDVPEETWCELCDVKLNGRTQVMPDVGEEVWQKRFEHRSAAVNLTKTTSQYQRFAVARAQGVAVSPEPPRTPDPTDRSVSKRAWEKAMGKWKSFHQKAEVS